MAQTKKRSIRVKRKFTKRGGAKYSEAFRRKHPLLFKEMKKGYVPPKPGRMNMYYGPSMVTNNNVTMKRMIKQKSKRNTLKQQRKIAKERAMALRALENVERKEKNFERQALEALENVEEENENENYENMAEEALQNLENENFEKMAHEALEEVEEEERVANNLARNIFSIQLNKRNKNRQY